MEGLGSRCRQLLGSLGYADLFSHAIANTSPYHQHSLTRGLALPGLHHSAELNELTGIPKEDDPVNLEALRSGPKSI